MRLLIVSTQQRLSDYIEFAGALVSQGVEVACVQDLRYCFLSDFRPLHIVPFPKLLKLVKRFDPEFVMTDSPYYIPHMSKLVDRRVLFHMRRTLSEPYWERATYPSFFVRMYNHYLATINVRSIKGVDLILPNSKWLQEQIKKQLPNHSTEVLYVGINPEKWVPTHNAAFNLKHPAAIGVFPFTIYQKVLGLLKFIRVVKKMPDVNFYFVGDGPYYNLVKQNCPSNMFLIGRVPRSGVKKLLESGDVFVHPSGLDVLPRSVKEASLMEKAIIASNVGGTPEIVRNNQTGYLCNVNDVDQWIEKIRFLLDNQDIARGFGRNAREFVIRNFNWKKIAKGFLENLWAFRTAS